MSSGKKMTDTMTKPAGVRRVQETPEMFPIQDVPTADKATTSTATSVKPKLATPESRGGLLASDVTRPTTTTTTTSSLSSTQPPPQQQQQQQQRPVVQPQQQAPTTPPRPATIRPSASKRPVDEISTDQTAPDVAVEKIIEEGTETLQKLDEESHKCSLLRSELLKKRRTLQEEAAEVVQVVKDLFTKLEEAKDKQKQLNAVIMANTQELQEITQQWQKVSEALVSALRKQQLHQHQQQQPTVEE